MDLSTAELLEWLVNQLDTATRQGGNPINPDLMVDDVAVFVEDFNVYSQPRHAMASVKLSNGQSFDFRIAPSPAKR